MQKYRSAHQRLCAAVDLNCAACAHIWLPDERQLETLMRRQPITCQACDQGLVLADADYQAMTRRLTRAKLTEGVVIAATLGWTLSVLGAYYCLGNVASVIVGAGLSFVGWSMKEVFSSASFLNVELQPSGQA